MLAGAENPEGAEALVDFLLSRPSSRRRCRTRCTSSRSTPAPQLPRGLGGVRRRSPTDPFTVDPAEIAEHRDEWLREWSDVTSR